MQTFFDFTPPKHLNTGVASVCGPGVRHGMYDFHSTALLVPESKAELRLDKESVP